MKGPGNFRKGDSSGWDGSRIELRVGSTKVFIVLHDVWTGTLKRITTVQAGHNVRYLTRPTSIPIHAISFTVGHVNEELQS